MPPQAENLGKLPPLAAFLLEPGSYPHHPEKVELVQTQMSFLFLAGQFVYKVKKPVNLGYLDYTTLEKRRLLCEKEVELNRRLSPEIYLGVVAITRENGQFRLEGSGQIVEYAVKMRQLPRERMMDVLLARDEVTPMMIKGVARKVADFHRQAASAPQEGGFGTLKVIITNTDENFSQTEKYINIAIPSPEYHRIREYTNRFIQEKGHLFGRRVAEKRIKDCHGDLHAAHICFAEDIYIYDCIEFNERFRYTDVVSEVAFLAMDLDHYGRGDLGSEFVRSYIELSGDREIGELLDFYKGYMAYVRGKVACFKSDDAFVPASERQLSVATARSYFDLAFWYTRPTPFLFITAGLTGTGKTTLAKALCGRLGLVLVSADVVRKSLAGVPLTERHLEGYRAGIYTEAFSRRTYDEMLRLGEKYLSEGRSVVLDATFMKKEGRAKAKALAARFGGDFLVIECILDEKLARKRLEKRFREGSVSDGRWENYHRQKQEFDRIEEFPLENYIRVDMAEGPEKALEPILRKVI